MRALPRVNRREGGVIPEVDLPAATKLYTRDVDFEWDETKDLINQQKHDIPFAEALTAFGDPLARTVSDPRHSYGEYRYLTTGYTSSGRLVIVAHTDRSGRIRLITARDAKPKERRFYERQP
jgi:uncharacterized DUF497 family protein